MTLPEDDLVRLASGWPRESVTSLRGRILPLLEDAYDPSPLSMLRKMKRDEK